MADTFSVFQTVILFSVCVATSPSKIVTKKALTENINRTTSSNAGNISEIYTKAADIDSRGRTPFYFLHRRLSSEDIKKTLNNFSMAKHNSVRLSNSEFRASNKSVSQNIPILNLRKKSLETEQGRDYGFRPSPWKVNGQLNQFPPYSTTSKDNHIFEVLNKQAKLMEKLVNFLEMEHHNLRSNDEFDNLITEAEKTKEKHEIKTLTTAKKRGTEKLSTVMTVVDETEIRNALKRDPHVKRILKMAENKRQKYLKAAQIYYKNFN